MLSLSFRDTLQKFWNEWEVRVLRTASAWVGALVWIVSLEADWVATVSLGIISRSQRGSPNETAELDASAPIAAFWTPFLLLHLGGPDIITANSLQDNELWLRHLIGLIVQRGGAFYVFLSSWSRFRDSLLPAAEAGPDYALFMDEYARREAQGLGMTLTVVIEPEFNIRVIDEATPPKAKLLKEAYFFFNIFRGLYADLILSFHGRDECLTVLRNKLSKEDCKLIETELGVMFYVLYSKTSIAYSRAGMFLRLLSFYSLVSALVAFSVAVTKRTFSGIDVTLTYLLLAGAICIETNTSFMLIFSERILLHLTKHNAEIGLIVYRWSGSISQYNLIGFCVEDKPGRLEGIQKFFRLHERFCGVEFDQSILLWHIATDLCNYSDLQGCQDDTPSSKSKISESLSDYMLYLLVIRPLMLPKGIGEIREENPYRVRRSKACRLLLQVNKTIPPGKVKGDRSKSVLSNGRVSLQALETENQREKEEKWDIIVQVWIEMLSYAVSQFKWNLHIQQLTQGGELLTHVSFLTAHVGLSKQFQISKWNARVRSA
ncbi:hypothetical protein NMG60_11002392 [Bertholletia excelsa]